jgi:hypothetical protein
MDRHGKRMATSLDLLLARDGPEARELASPLVQAGRSGPIAADDYFFAFLPDRLFGMTASARKGRAERGGT